MMALRPVSSSWQNTTCSCPPVNTELTSLSDTAALLWMTGGLLRLAGDDRAVRPRSGGRRYRSAPGPRRCEDRPTSVALSGTVHALRVFGHLLGDCSKPAAPRGTSARRFGPLTGVTPGD